MALFGKNQFSLQYKAGALRSSWAQQVPYLDRLGGGPCDHGYTHAITRAIPSIVVN
jgi:hypothetical protein